MGGNVTVGLTPPWSCCASQTFVVYSPTDHGLKNGDEHPTSYTPHGVWHTLRAYARILILITEKCEAVLNKILCI